MSIRVLAVCVALIALTPSAASAVEVTKGEGILVIDFTAAETKSIATGVSTALDIAEKVAPSPYREVLKVASLALDVAVLVVGDKYELRLVVTALPPAVIPFSKQRSASEIVKAYKKNVIEAAQALADFFDNNMLVMVPITTTNYYGPQTGGSMTTTTYVWVTIPLAKARKTAQAGRIESDRTKVGDWEQFKLVSFEGGTCALRAHTGFLCAEGGGGKEAVFNRDAPKEWERWVIVKHADGKVSLKAANGQYLSCRNPSKATADATTVQETEKFILTLEKGSVTLKTSEGRYLSSQP